MRTNANVYEPLSPSPAAFCFLLHCPPPLTLPLHPRFSFFLPLQMFFPRPLRQTLELTHTLTLRHLHSGHG